ncbi:MAG TPA: VTT domain-containing protein [Chitinophagaceae bacterium]|nr:VTT domain-containing protein [Chitinophagaceae bacterium]
MIHLLTFNWHDLLQPQFYIQNGGLWLLLFVIFAETGLFAGFFLPGDSLLFVAGIYAQNMDDGSPGLSHEFLKLIGLGTVSNEWLDLVTLIVLVSVAGILGNLMGYWFDKKSGPFLFQRKDTFLFKKKYLHQAHDFYERYGGWAIVAARFVPIIRTFAPIVAGIVQMDKKKFSYYNIIGCFAWVSSMILAGHFLQKWILNQFGFDLKDHLEIIVLGIVLLSTVPILYKLFFSKDKKETA